MSDKNNQSTTSSTDKKLGGFEVLHKPDPSVNPDEYNMDPEIFILSSNEPFLGRFAMELQKKQDWAVDTAYVGISKETRGIVMGYNPDFMRKLDKKHRQGVFKHEYYHVLFSHLTSRSGADPKRHQLRNIAADLAINSIICATDNDALPDFCLMPGKAPKFCQDKELSKLIENFPKMQTLEWYMGKLEEYAEENGKTDGQGNYSIEIGNGDGESLDSHDGWGDIPEDLKDIIREQINQMVGEGMKAVQKTNQWGSVPSEIQGLIEKMLKHEVDWRTVLRMFAGKARSNDRDSTVRKINKKAPYKFPGVRRQEVARLLFCVDQSGSMSDEDVSLGLGEAFACSKEAAIDIINFDTEIDADSFREVTKGKPFKWERTRCGGTDFNCVMRFVNSQKNRGRWTGVVIVTDGYADNMGQIIGAKVLWLVTPGGTLERVRPGDLVAKMKSGDASVKKG